MKLPHLQSRIQKVPKKFKDGIELYVKREDEIHPTVSGNKYRKLKYNLLEAEAQGKTMIISFGGAFSNHISALAVAGNAYGFKTFGIIRGEELASKIESNPTLSFAKSCGMRFKFVSRQAYQMKTAALFLEELGVDVTDAFVIPEGGTNHLAVKGCQEILDSECERFPYICCPVGTGGTMAGLINAKTDQQTVLGFPALKGSFLKDEILKFAADSGWQLITDYHFGGYAKVSDDLVAFINRFKRETGIPLDPVYTGKMMFGIHDLIESGFFPKNSKILAIHTGGLQGIEGMNQLLKQQNRTQIV